MCRKRNLAAQNKLQEILDKHTVKLYFSPQTEKEITRTVMYNKIKRGTWKAEGVTRWTLPVMLRCSEPLMLAVGTQPFRYIRPSSASN
eukprot:12842459-Heterocapsa_arctica.AAC.1